MATVMVPAADFRESPSRVSTHSNNSCSKKRQSFRLPSPRGCAGTWPKRAQRIKVRLSILKNGCGFTCIKELVCHIGLHYRLGATLPRVEWAVA